MVDPEDDQYYTVAQCLEFLPYTNSLTILRKIKDQSLKADWYGHRVGYRIKGAWIKEFRQSILNRKRGGQK
jgi:hypothetical protein